MDTATRERLHSRIESLDRSTGVTAPKSCYQVTSIAGVLVPFVVVAVLYFMKPKIVTSEVGGVETLDNKKLLVWATGLTAAIWIVLFSYHNYAGSKTVCF